MNDAVIAKPIGGILYRTKIILEMIKFEHTIFAMPFAFMAAFVASRGLPTAHDAFWIVIAMVGARSAAMAFNRIADWKYDAINPRTANRAIPAGQLTVPQVSIFTVIACAVLVLAAYNLKPLAFMLSPVAIIAALGYSLTKRFTAFSHAFLGLALAVAPMGAWIAIRGTFDAAPMALAGAVLFWLFGFDIIYALQDTDFDREAGLHSIPAALGNMTALIVSRCAHVVMIGLLVLFGVLAHLHAIYYGGVAFVMALVTYEQSLVKADDLSKLNFAFFNLNGYISVGLFLFTTADILLLR